MTVRDEIVAQLAALPKLRADVEPYARNVVVDSDTVMVRLDRVTKNAAWRTYEGALLLLVPTGNDVARAEDDLDGLLEDVLYALEQPGAPLVWTAAERAVFNDTTPAYEVAFRIHPPAPEE